MAETESGRTHGGMSIYVGGRFPGQGGDANRAWGFRVGTALRAIRYLIRTEYRFIGGLGEPALPEAKLGQHAVLPLPQSLLVKPDPRLGSVLGLGEIGGVGKRGAGLKLGLPFPLPLEARAGETHGISAKLMI